jgi:hypothetical protein
MTSSKLIDQASVPVTLYSCILDVQASNFWLVTYFRSLHYPLHTNFRTESSYTNASFQIPTYSLFMIIFHLIPRRVSFVVDTVLLT